jgi:hypothetical protein
VGNPIVGIGLLRGVYMPIFRTIKFQGGIPRLGFRSTAVSQLPLAAPDREIAGSPQ